MIYYELLKDGSIGRHTNNIKIAQLRGYFNENQVLEKAEDIIFGYDDKLYVKGTEPQKPQELIEQQIIEDLRDKRKTECFDVLNDYSRFWYDNLTTEQHDELKSWYNAWLDVTDTKIIPTKPSWLK